MYQAGTSPGPIPRHSGHIVEAVSVRLIRADGTGGKVSIHAGVVTGKLTLPNVGPGDALVGILLSPDIGLVFQSAPRGIFPFGLTRELFAGPLTIRGRIEPRDLHHWVVVLSF
jgi:hypothetical protein